MTHTYRNPWAKHNEPQDYIRNTEPVEYKGCLIFRVHHTQYDIVKAGACIAQRCGYDSATIVADIIEDMEAPTHEDVKARMLERYGHY